MGGGSVANIASGVAGAYKPSDVASDKAHVWTSTRNAIAVGDAANSITRQITGVAAGSADTDAVNVAQLTAAVAGAGGGTAYTAGNGVAISGTNELSVNANTDDFAFDSDKKLQINKNGSVVSENTGLVTGDTVYTAMQTETRVTADGNYVLKANSAAANLTALDTQVKANADDIGTLTAAVADKANAADVYSKTDADTAFATKTALAEVKDTADTNKAALEALGDVQELAKDAEKILNITNDIDDLKKQDGVLAKTGEPHADEFVKGSRVYDYLNRESLVMGENSTNIAIGKSSKATGGQSIAIGFGNKVSGANSGAFGDPNDVSGSGSYAIGNDNTVSGDNTFVLGSEVTADKDKAVVLGYKSTAEEGAVSVGSADIKRQIKNVKDGKEDSDAATVGQMNAAIDNAVGNNMVRMNNSINKLDSRINKVGAGAAALAALHPIDTDDKFSMGLGYGNYHGSNAMALGLFYRPTDNVMLSVGGAMGNGENMINAGISFALDSGKGFGTSKAAMARKINTLSEENAAMKEKLNAQDGEIAALKEALARLEAKIGK